MSSPSFGRGPGLRLVEGCPAAWSSSEVSGSRKVTHQCKPVRLHVGDWAWLLSLALHGPMAPLALPSGPSSWPVLAVGAVANVWPCAGS